MMIVTMRMKTTKSVEELDRLSEEGIPKFRELDGLVQKYYIKNHENGEVGGVYLFDNETAARDYVHGPIVATVAERFRVVGEVKIEVLEVARTLNP